MKKIVNLLGTATISAQETKQTNKQNNLLTLTVSCEKSCLIRI